MGLSRTFSGGKDKPQPFKVDVVLFMTKNSGRTDDIEATVDYSRVFHEVRQVVEQSSFNLIETLAEEISLRILKRFPLLTAVETTVYKPQAPIEGSLIMWQYRFIAAGRIWCNPLREHIMTEAYIGLGSNVGDRVKNVERAWLRSQLCRIPGLLRYHRFISPHPGASWIRMSL